MITVFTPAYNRGYIIRNLYDSLCNQTSKNFEWLIVDDGSSDNTEILVNEFISQQKITIRYFKQLNGGKHRAINKGVKAANGDLFFILDSDDFLADNAIDRIEFHFESIKDDDSFAGVCGLRSDKFGARIGGEHSFNILDCTSLDFRFRYRILGDMAEVFKTSILQKYLFPEIDGEFFCPEALIWNRLSLKYKLRFFYEKIYICEYRTDGLSAKITKLRMESPQSSMTYYSELYNYKIPIRQKIKAAINYWRFALCKSDFSILVGVDSLGFSGLFLFVLGIFMHLKDKSTLN